MNIWTGIILGVVALGVYGLSKLSRTSNELITEVKGRIHSLDFQNITFAIDAMIKNPTQTALIIQYPFIKISHKDNLIASSQIVDETIRITPLSQTDIKGIKIPVSYLKLGGISLDLLKKLQNRDAKITMQVTILTSVNIGGADIPYSKTEDITF